MQSLPGLLEDDSGAGDLHAGPDTGTAGWPQPLILLTALLSGRSDLARGAAAKMRGPDWDSFAGLVIRRHRVAPSVVVALDRTGLNLPEPTAARIRSEARANAFAALAQKAESLRIAAGLGGLGVRAVWLKGWPLAEQFYGGAGLRHASDIDILVSPEDRLAAAGYLVDLGYVAADEHALRQRLIRLRAIRDECKDVQYIHPGTGLVVELHWRTSHFRGWPEFGDLAEEPLAAPGTGDCTILTPGPLEQLVYLSGHGVQHLYGRLKWLLDIDRLAALRGADALARDLAQAESAGAGRPVRLSLHLANRVFGTEVPEAARNLPAAEAVWAAEILASIADPQAEPGRPKARLGFYTWHLRLSEGPRQAIGVLRYAVWRRLRLGLAGATHPAEGRKA